MTQWGKKRRFVFILTTETKYNICMTRKKTLSFINKKVKTILDYGCAVGGFYLIFKKYLKEKFHT